MALTGHDDDSSSDDEIGETPRNESKAKKEQTTAGAELSGLLATAANVVRQKENSGEETQTCNNLPSSEAANETVTKVPSQVGAGLLFGVSGLLLGGPILALLTGVGATYVASKDEGPVGEAARASGDFAIATSAKVGEAAKEANEKHGVIEKIKNAFRCGWSRVQQFDEEHKATEKVKETMSDVGQKTVEFEKKHHFMENILEGIQNGVGFLLGKLKDTTGESCNGNTSASS